MFGDVNWSGFAKDAFTSQVQILKLKGNDMHTQAGLERLRSSRNANKERVKAEAFVVGKEWALEDAEYDSLKRVTELNWEKIEDDDGALKTLSNAIGDDQYLCAEAYQMLRENKVCSIEAVEGFVDGATEVFNAIDQAV